MTNSTAPSSDDDTPTTDDEKPFRGDGRTLSTAIAEAVSTTRQRPDDDLPDLEDAVDVEAIHTLVTRPGDRVAVSFTYADAWVTVRDNGRIEVRPDAGDPSSHDGPGTDAEFHTRLRELLVAAHRRGIPVMGGWAMRNEPQLPDWDVHITGVVKPDAQEQPVDG